MDLDYSAFVNGKKTMLLAPAGYGKTHTIVECLKYTTGKQLILTHTHAGVAAIKEKIKAAGIENRKYHIETICSFAQKYVHAFYTESDIPEQENKNYFPFIIEKASALFNIAQVKKVIEVTYSGLFVDEYQDCLKTQHQMIMVLSNLLPTHILGDHMQGIFNFNGEIVNFDSDIKDFEISRLDTPHRWYKNGRHPLGDSLKTMRASLEDKQSINLSDYENIKCLYFYVVAPGDITVRDSRYKRLLNGVINNPNNRSELNSLLILVPNTYEKSNINKRKRLRAQINYNKSLTLIEAIDDKDLYKVAKNIDKVINSPKSYMQLKKNILRHIFNAKDINNWFSDNGLKNKTTPQEKMKSYKLKSHLDNFIANPSPFAMLTIIKNLIEKFKFKYGREELLKGIMKALYTATHENTTVYEGMKRHRNVVRRIGRKVTGKCLGTTLLCKGLEFDTVVILDAHEFDCPKHLYVALTRCCKKLIIFTENLILSPYKSQ